MDTPTFCFLFREADICTTPEIIFVRTFSNYADNETLRSIFALAHATPKDLVYAAGHTIRSIGTMLQLSPRTIEGWTSGRKIPYHIRLLFAMLCCNPTLDVPRDFSL